MEETAKIKTVCGYCGTGCGLILDVDQNKIVKIRGDKDAPVNKGQTCVKGSFAYEYVHANSRLTSPLIRKAGKLVETTWDEAYQFIVEKLKEIKTQFGPDAITMFATARSTNEVNYVTQKFMRTIIGSNNIDGCNRT
ncbi:molybdopterin-dependent oxidoreductase [Cytobacillus dafuensis]|uniref:Molybdopterin-dependent oxidoreductase n=3 Tax=Cytobacillus dafuensis TaxID=1742359 RepID=A0A5B8Z9P2_CYTDA|nr:molybdopterin-dependent oxidoreductase [Cytobacillus dafuensis]